HLERLHDRDVEAGDEVAENALQRDAEPEAGDAETRDERRHLDADLVEHRDERERQDCRAYRADDEVAYRQIEGPTVQSARDERAAPAHREQANEADGGGGPQPGSVGG